MVRLDMLEDSVGSSVVTYLATLGITEKRSKKWGIPDLYQMYLRFRRLCVHHHRCLRGYLLRGNDKSGPEGKCPVCLAERQPYDSATEYTFRLNGSTTALRYGEYIRYPMRKVETVEIGKRENTLTVRPRGDGRPICLGVGGCCELGPVPQSATILDYPEGFAALLLQTALTGAVVSGSRYNR